jgi:V-type H+-transporting ATPase subunit H
LVPALISSPDPYKPLLPLLQHSSNAEDPIPLLTSDLLISLVPASLRASSRCPARDEAALPKLYTYLSTLTRNQDSGLQDIGVQGFSSLLRTQRSRELFWNLRAETVEPLTDILWAASGGKDSESSALGATGSVRTADIGLAGGVGLQLLYNVLVVIWQLSFEADLVGNELQAYGTIFTSHHSKVKGISS